MSYYFDNDTKVESKEVITKAEIGNILFTFITDNNVFSKRGLDFGTRTLLENIDDINGDILDFGCGYGPIGIYLKKKFNVNVDMIDINKRALNLAIKNAKLNNVDVMIFESNIYEQVTKKYDYIITNPPIRAGKEVVYKMLRGAKDHLKDDGFLYFVMRKDHGAKTAIRDISDIYNAEVICKEKGFFVIKCFSR